MPLPATDAFAGRGNNPLANSANWTTSGAQDCQTRDTNDIAGDNNGSGTSLTHWSADSFADDHSSEFVVTSVVTSTDWIGPGVRLQGGAKSGYVYWMRSTDSQLRRFDAGSQTAIGGTGEGYAATDVIYLEISSTTLDPKKNGATDANIGTQTDATYSSGSAGVGALDNSNNNRIDDFTGDDLGAAPGRTTFNTDPRPLGMFAGVSRGFNAP